MATNLTNPELLNKSISDQVVEIAKAGTSVAARTNVFQAKGQTKIIVDMGNTAAGIIAEGASVTASDPANFKEVLLRQKRMASAIEVTVDAVQNSALPLESHVAGVLADRIVRGIEAQMFNTGDAAGTTGLQNIVLYNSLATGAKIEDTGLVTGAGVGTVAHADVINALAVLAKQPENLEGAIWVVEDITKLANVKDSANQSLMTFDNLPAGAVGRVMGIPVFKTVAFTAGQKVAAVLINPAKAYAVSLAENANVKKIKGDTLSELKQMSTFLGECYLDGKVVNPRAVVLVKTA
ncbi:phage major capsid protein [Bacillus sp. F19]|nr:phage major capsid protein [Bacillus sp. F19]